MYCLKPWYSLHRLCSGSINNSFLFFPLAFPYKPRWCRIVYLRAIFLNEHTKVKFRPMSSLTVRLNLYITAGILAGQHCQFGFWVLACRSAAFLSVWTFCSPWAFVTFLSVIQLLPTAQKHAYRANW